MQRTRGKRVQPRVAHRWRKKGPKLARRGLRLRAPRTTAALDAQHPCAEGVGECASCGSHDAGKKEVGALEEGGVWRHLLLLWTYPLS